MATVLIVDDAALIRLAMKTLLDHEGHKTLCAANGLEAINHLRGGDLPDLVLLDLAMPEMDGMTTLQMLRHQPETRRLPVIVMSSQTENEVVQEALRRGANEYLVKSSLSWDEVRNRITPYLNRREHEENGDSEQAREAKASTSRGMYH
jgi:two-component system chemotaxis response regulator CheY